MQGTQEIGYGTLYVYVGLFILMVVGFVATTLVLARLIAPSRRSSRMKGQIYETGEATVTDPWRPTPSGLPWKCRAATSRRALTNGLFLET